MIKLEKTILSVLCATILLSACSKETEDYASADMAAAEATSEDMTSQQSSASVPPQSARAESSTEPTIQSDTEISHNLTVGSSATKTKKPLQVTMKADFTVDDVFNAVANIEKLTQKYQGYVALSNIGNNEGDPTKRVQGDIVTIITPYERHANMEVRIPRRNVAKFLEELQEDIKFLRGSNFIAVDKTFDIYLQQLQIEVNKAMATELNEQRLDAPKTNSEDQSQNQSSNLDSIRATYESKNRQALAQVERLRLKDSVEYSKLTLNFSQPREVYQTQIKNIEAVIEAAEPSFGQQLLDSLKYGLDGLKNFVLWFASIWWFWILLIISVPVFKILWRFWRDGKLWQRRAKNPLNKDSDVNDIE